MSFTDPIADMLTRIRNAYKAMLLKVMVPYSSHKMQILSVLQQEGYVEECVVHDERPGVKIIEVELKYSNSGRPAIDRIERVSKPSRRMYYSYKDLPKAFNGLGTVILTTSAHGVISDRMARRMKVGGEVLCKVF